VDLAKSGGEGNPPALLNLNIKDRRGLITTIPDRNFRFAKAPRASEFAPGEFVIFNIET